MAILVLATLYVRRGKEREFRDFEARALEIAASHGGELLRAVRLAEKARDEDAPYEFHLLSFPSESAFDAFRTDPERARLSGDAERVLARTEVVTGVDCTGEYTAF